MVSFYSDQGTHHAAALTYYALMSLFPALLLALSLLGLLGEFPAAYDAMVTHLRQVVPTVTLAPLDAAVRAALKSKGTAAAGLVIAILTALYGATGYLEAARRALNVVFEATRGRSFTRRKLIDVASTFVLMALVLTTLLLMFAGGGVAQDVLGGDAASIWRIAGWPGAFASALLVFSFIYHVTPDVRQRAFRWITPGALVGVAVWLAASAAFSTYLANFKSFQRHLRLLRCRHHLARLAVAHQRRAAVRRRSQRRDRTRRKSPRKCPHPALLTSHPQTDTSTRSRSEAG